MRKELANGGRDAAIARIATNQHGVISAGQLRAVGLFPSRVADRVTAGRLHPLHRGVYGVGHTNVGNEGRWMAAVLACGDDAVLSHVSAGALWGVLKADRRARPGGSEIGGAVPGVAIVDVTVPGTGGRARRSGIRVHRSKTLLPGHCIRCAGIPVTRPARTLEDLRRILPGKQSASALREAEFLQLPLDPHPEPDRTRSELEARFLTLCRRHGLPQPEVNVRVDGFVVDFLWRAERLVVEVDGWESHRTRSAFEGDRARDTRLRVRGFEVLRFTWRQLSDDPGEVARAVRTLLRRQPW